MRGERLLPRGAERRAGQIRPSSTAWQATSEAAGRKQRAAARRGSARWRAGSAGGTCSRSADRADSAPRPAPACAPGRSCGCRGSHRAACACRDGAARRRASPCRRSSTMRPEVHHADLVAHVADHRQVVRDEQVGEALGRLQLLHEVEHLRLHRDVERRGRLVADEEFRVASRARARSRSAAAARPRTDAGTSRRRPRPGRPTPSSSPTARGGRRRRESAAASPAGGGRARAAARRRCRAPSSAGSGSRTDPGRSSACGGAAPAGRRSPSVDAVEVDRPRVGAYRPTSRRATVLLPQPDSPTSASVVPRAIVKADVVDGMHELPRLALDDAIEPRRRNVEGLRQAGRVDEGNGAGRRTRPRTRRRCNGSPGRAAFMRRPGDRRRAASRRPASRRQAAGRAARCGSGRTRAGSAG